MYVYLLPSSLLVIIQCLALVLHSMGLSAENQLPAHAVMLLSSISSSAEKLNFAFEHGSIVYPVSMGMQI